MKYFVWKKKEPALVTQENIHRQETKEWKYSFIIPALHLETFLRIQIVS